MWTTDSKLLLVMINKPLTKAQKGTFVTDKGFVWVYLLRKEGDAHLAVILFFKMIGIPDVINFVTTSIYEAF